jgi:hypothetical protein
MARKRHRRRRATPELTLDELNKQLEAYSDRVSTQLRTINLGVLGITWLLLLKQHDVERLATRISERGLLCIALICIIVLGFDILQYRFAERTVEDAFDRAENSASKKAAYYADSFNYQAQLWCYRLKLTITGLNALALIVLVGFALIG